MAETLLPEKILQPYAMKITVSLRNTVLPSLIRELQSPLNRSPRRRSLFHRDFIVSPFLAARFIDVDTGPIRADAMDLSDRCKKTGAFHSY